MKAKVAKITTMSANKISIFLSLSAPLEDSFAILTGNTLERSIYLESSKDTGLIDELDGP